ncbi:hypothetical protein GALL_493180 [mine drainage metagenome]|uniref:Uncharacterized protein n=1 Tax=mine drainage metagenome TaxID=410659 RepID=A0A1J5PNB7_9ZZZZ
MGMPARQMHHRVAAQSLRQTTARQISLIKPDKDQRHAPALPLDQRIGGERGGQRHHRHLARRNTRLQQRRVNRPPDPQRQIPARRQRLGRGDHRRLALVHDHRIRIGAAGIDPEKNRHLSCLVLPRPFALRPCAPRGQPPKRHAHVAPRQSDRRQIPPPPKPRAPRAPASPFPLAFRAPPRYPRPAPQARGPDAAPDPPHPRSCLRWRRSRPCLGSAYVGDAAVAGHAPYGHQPQSHRALHRHVARPYCRPLPPRRVGN